MANNMAMLILAAAAVAVVAHGSALAKTAPAGGQATKLPGLGQKLEDHFATLKDEFDAELAGNWLASEEALARLSDADAVHAFATKTVVLKLFFNLMTFIVLACGARRYCSEGIKPMAFRLSSELAASAAAARPKRETSQSQELEFLDFGPLMQAARAGDRTIWLHLLQMTRGIEQRTDVCGCTALHASCHAGCPEMVEMLLQCGLDANAKEACEDSPLHFAARTGNVEVCKLLLASGADINATNYQGETPVLAAGIAGMEDACEFLLEQGGGLSGAADSDMPPLLTMLLFRRMLKPLSASSTHARREQQDRTARLLAEVWQDEHSEAEHDTLES